MTPSKDPTRPKLSISLVLYDTNPDILLEAIRSMANAVAEAKTQNLIHEAVLFIVQNSNQVEIPSDSIERILASKEINFVLKQNTTNIGFGRAHNQIIKNELSDFSLILNPDTLLHKDSLSIGLNFLKTHPSVSVIGPKGFDPDCSYLSLSKSYPSVTSLFFRGLKSLTNIKLFDELTKRYQCAHLEKAKKPQRVEITSGCMMLCRTDHLKQIKGFNERFFLYFEDFDLCLRIKKIGDIYFLPNMTLIHRGGNTARKGLKHIWVFIRSAIIFFNCHGWRIF